MPRLIDADALMEQVREVKQVTEVSLNHGKEYCHTFLAPSHVKRLIDNAPSIEPKQPEIIRCRDCKHYQFADDYAFGMPVKRCRVLDFEDFDDDDFCSRAERRGDD